MKILLVDDDDGSREMLAGAIKDFNHEVVECSNPVLGLKIFKNQIFDAVFTDLKMPEKNGIELLTDIRSIDTEIPVILCTAYSSVDTAIQAMKAGAYDYLIKPINMGLLETLLQKISKYINLYKEVKKLRKKIKDSKSDESPIDIIGEDPQFQKVLSTCGRIAEKEVNLLIQGESGTGKEKIARLVHSLSNRTGKFVALNCGAIPENLIESELFGFKKGAFTGAVADTPGKFETANKGTLFLDEVGELPLNAQVKLLRVLQEKQVTPLGSNQTLDVDVKIIAATNKNLKQCMDTEEFREDLYWRIAVVTLDLPSLRERREDIEPLTKHFLQKNNIEITSEAMAILRRYDWPGNVRELENVIQRAAALCYENIITVDDLAYNVRKNNTSINYKGFERNKLSLPEWLNYLEQEEINKALVEANGVQVKAAELLGISERMLRYNMKKYRIIAGTK